MTSSHRSLSKVSRGNAKICRRFLAPSLPLIDCQLGARAYYFRNVLHDWSDSNCEEILRNTFMAMTPGYSKILINELVLPVQGAGPYATRSDFNMMALLAGMERTEKQWHELLGKIGLKIQKIWSTDSDCESIVEAVRF